MNAATTLGFLPRPLRERPAIDKAHFDFDRLRALPASTLGGAYVRYLDEKNLDPDLFQDALGVRFDDLDRFEAQQVGHRQAAADVRQLGGALARPVDPARLPGPPRTCVGL